MLEFEFFDCNGRTLFYPVNDEALQACRLTRCKNLTEERFIYLINNGFKIKLYPRISFNPEILKRVTYESNRLFKS